MTFPRSSGILLHISSLPTPYGIGDFGPSAYRFADFLARARQQIWQVLPLVPVGHGNSPYSSPSTFAGNYLFISPDGLRHDGLLTDDDFTDRPDFPTGTLDYEQAVPYKLHLLGRAYERFRSGGGTLEQSFERFCRENEEWLEDYALFMALKEATDDAVWTAWPAELVHRDPDALGQARRERSEAVERQKFWQFLFERQWSALKSYCHERGIRIFGDLPIYVAHDSADVWAAQDLFHLDEEGNPTVVAGVPPDYFSETGQRWGNPIYRWDLMQAKGYRWWTRRIAATLRQVDLVRLDHFRAFEAYWEIPASEPTAVNGRWVKGPGSELFHVIARELGRLPLVAEDLGLITDEVRSMMRELDLPGMVVLQFAFASGSGNSYLPHNYVKNAVAYSGTHDNDTMLGWWDALEERQAESPEPIEERRYAARYLDLGVNGRDEVPWASVRAVFGSVADLAVVPLQDVLGLGGEARMNMPGRGDNNWAWRLQDGALDATLARRLADLTETYGRTGESR